MYIFKYFLKALLCYAFYVFHSIAYHFLNNLIEKKSLN